MKIQDANGKEIPEIIIRLSSEELTDLLVGTSEVEGDSADHALLRDKDGNVLAIYRSDAHPAPLQAGLDWWIGPILLIVIVLLIAGVLSVSRAILDLFF